MKKNTTSEMSRFVQSEEGYLLIGHHEAQAALEAALQAVEAALLCIGEGNTARAGQLLYSALPKDRRPIR